MKRILALGTAALIASASGASAGHGITKDIHLDGYCNIYHINITAGLANAQDTPGCSGTYGGGLVATVKDTGKTVTLAIQDASSPGVQRMLVLSYPFTTGGTFKLYETTNGLNFHLALDGTYSLDAAPQDGSSITARR